MSKPKTIITEYRSYNLTPHFPVILLSGDYWKISDIPSPRLHFHNCLEIGIVHSGSGTLQFSEKCLNFKAGDVTIIPRNVSHTTYSSPGTQSHWSYLFLNPKELFFNFSHNTRENYDLSMYYLNSYKHILSKNDYPKIHYLFTHIIKEMSEQKSGYQSSVTGMLLSTYIDICRIQNSQNTSLNSVKQYTTLDNALVIAPVLDYIEANYMRSFDIKQLSNLCHWSPAHFRRVFHDMIGTSPLDFFNNTRILKSCDLLRSTQESILNISEIVGFHSPSSYNRYFTRVMNMSPREYRKQSIQTDTMITHPTILKCAGWIFPEK